MANYTAEEIEAFRLKDLRIARSAMLKSLIEGFGESETLDVQKMCKIADGFVYYIYNGLGGKTEEPYINDVETIELPTPNAAQSEVLNAIIDKWSQVDFVVDREKLKAAIINEFNKYPSNLSSVDKVMSIIDVNDILE